MKNFSKLPLSVWLALIGLILIGVYTFQLLQPPKRPDIKRLPAKSSFMNTLSGSGIIEPVGENITVGSFSEGKVISVFVKPGMHVEKGSPLYQLDHTLLNDELQQLQAEAQVKKAFLEERRHGPRTADINPFKCAVEEIRVNLADAKEQLTDMENVEDSRAISQQELKRKKTSVKIFSAQLAEANADLARAQAGYSSFAIQQSRADYQLAQARVQQLKTRLAQTIVRAPSSAEVLQVRVHPGEFIEASSSLPTVILGQTNQLQVRVDIDEVNASQVEQGMQAEALLKGDGQKRFPLQFHHIEPYIIPKKNLTGNTGERVDVRVLQIIYRFNPPSFPVYVGQQVNVFLKKTQEN